MSRTIASIAAVLIALTGCRGAVTGPIAPATQNALNAAACTVVRANPPNAPAYADTLWPSEKHDQWRTAAAAGGLPSTVSSLRTKSVKLPPVPLWGYVGLDGDVYVMGGQPYLVDIYIKLILGSQESAQQLVADSLAYSETVTPYVAKIDPSTMTVTKILYLTKKHGVNYIGGMLVDSDGYLYAVARGFLYKIQPQTLGIVASKRLPLEP